MLVQVTGAGAHHQQYDIIWKNYFSHFHWFIYLFYLDENQEQEKKITGKQSGLKQRHHDKIHEK